MEEIRDYIRHLAFCGDAETGVLVRKNSREEIRIQLPVGGSVMFTRNGVYMENLPFVLQNRIPDEVVIRGGHGMIQHVPLLLAHLVKGQVTCESYNGICHRRYHTTCGNDAQHKQAICVAAAQLPAPTMPWQLCKA